jgi:hypothetical protein
MHHLPSPIPALLFFLVACCRVVVAVVVVLLIGVTGVTRCHGIRLASSDAREARSKHI